MSHVVDFIMAALVSLILAAMIVLVTELASWRRGKRQNFPRISYFIRR